MDSVWRVVVLYVFVLALVRLTGNRTLGEMTAFDLLLIVLVAEATTEFLTSGDSSLTNALLLITTFFALDVGFSLWKQRSRRIELLLEGTPVVVLENGTPLKDRMDKARVDEDDILEAGRRQGIGRLQDMRYAVLERSGSINVIPMPQTASSGG